MESQEIKKIIELDETAKKAVEKWEALILAKAEAEEQAEKAIEKAIEKFIARKDGDE